jgi:uncharacterized protein (TIGR03437 family)
MIPELPLRFEPAADGGFVATGAGFTVDLQSKENTLLWSGAKTAFSVRTRFPNARQDARIEGVEPLASRSNYFVGNSSARWRTNVANYERVRVTGLFSGVDLEFYGTAGKLEYDFVVHPGAAPDSIAFQIDGPHRMRVDASGDLILSRGRQRIRWRAPSLYQTASGKRSPVEGGFVIAKGNWVRFRVGKYDRAHNLVIDPALGYASYLGGSGKEFARSVVTDSAGNVYVAGATTSTNLAVTSGGLQPLRSGPPDAFVAKFSPSGTLIYMTYLGGSQIDYATGIAVDAAGNAYVTGMAASFDFPVSTSAYQKTFAGSGGNVCQRAGDAFVSKLNPSGSQLLYSTYLGGRRDDIAVAVAIDSAGNAYIAGSTLSTDFPTTPGAYQSMFRGFGGQTGKPICNDQPWFNSGDAFVAKLNPTGSQLVFSTYVGGSLDDTALAVAVDSSQNVYVGGLTISKDFPVTPGALQGKFGGIEPQNEYYWWGDGFVAKLNSTGTLIYSTYLGGSGDDTITSMYAASDGTLWVAGSSTSLNFPVTANAVQKTYAGYSILPLNIEQLIGDATLTHINASGTALLYSTYLGGSQNDLATAVTVDAAGLVYVAGFTESMDFPLTANAVQSRLAGSGGSNLYFRFGDGFVSVIDPSSPKLVYSSYFGGSQDDELYGLALDGAGGVWATGSTLSLDLPVTSNATQRAYGGQRDPTIGTWGDSLLVHFTNLTSPAVTVAGVQEASEFGAFHTIAPAAWVEIYGSNLDTSAGRLWSPSDFTNNGTQGPTSLDGVQVLVNGTPAVLSAVSPGQINAQMPDGIGANAASLVVKNANGTSAPFTLATAQRSPGLYAPAAFKSGGKQYVGAVLPDGARVGPTGLNPFYTFRPAQAGDHVAFFGGGFGPTIPPVPAGQVVSQTNSLPNVMVQFGGVSAAVEFSGEVQIGLYQINAIVPAGLSGDVLLTMTVDGVPVGQTLYITLQ